MQNSIFSRKAVQPWERQEKQSTEFKEALLTKIIQVSRSYLLLSNHLIFVK